MGEGRGEGDPPFRFYNQDVPGVLWRENAVYLEPESVLRTWLIPGKEST
jgi:hypothetical protein